MKRRYIQNLSGFTIHVDKHEYWRYEDMIKSNTSLNPEVVGLLLGRAQPTWEDVLCGVCKEKIPEGDEWNDDSVPLPKRLAWVHKYCGEKIREEAV